MTTGRRFEANPQNFTQGLLRLRSFEMMKKMAGFRLPASPPPPDLSNLTEEEKEIIQSVLERQKQMEDETTQLTL